MKRGVGKSRKSSKKKATKRAIKKTPRKKTVKKVASNKTSRKAPRKSVKKTVKKTSNKRAKSKVTKRPLKKRIRSKAKSKIVRVPTGIENLDKLVQGGFERASTNLLIGKIGCGKSIFLTQFLVEGTKHGEKALFINFEEKKEEFYANMLELGFDLGKLEKEGKFFFLEYTPQKVKTMLEEGGGEIEAIVLNEEIKRIAIDSMTSFTMLFTKELEKKETALQLFSLLRSWNCTSMLTAGNDVNDDPEILELEADSIIQLYFKRSLLQGRKRYLEVIKMRGTNHSLDLHEMEIEKGGIVLDQNPIQKAPKEFLKDKENFLE